MSSLARRTLRTSATLAGIAALGAGFAGQAFAADLPALPAAPELPTELPAAPDVTALDAPALPAAPALPDGVDVPGIITFESPNVTMENTSDAPAPVDANVAEGAGDEALAAPSTVPSSVPSTLPTASHEAAATPALPELPALPALPGAPEVNGDFASPLGSIPLAGPELPAAPAVPELGAPELPAAPALPTELPSTTGQDIDTTQEAAADAATPVDLASAIASLAG